MMKGILVTIEHGPKKTFASAADWPGWSRSGKTEELAIKALAAYASRYAVIAEAEHRRFAATPTVDDLEVVERLERSGGTEFGVPSRPIAHDARSTDADEAARLAGLVCSAWECFDRTAADLLRVSRDGEPLAGRRWPARYAAHRIAWHALDHAWEIEDRSERSE
jgi:hypothetical protein